MIKQKNRLYKATVIYRHFGGDGTINQMICYVQDSSWVFTCIPHDWNLSFMMFEIDYSDSIVSDHSAVIGDDAGG